MKYGMLLWPHANSRYQEAVADLAVHETFLLARAVNAEISPVMECVAGTQWICFESDAPAEKLYGALALHSMAYLFCAMRQDGSLAPLCGRAQARLGWDLGGVLKYKGKTNEAFTRCLMNYALCAGTYAKDLFAPLHILDPMCGRGTALFEAVNRGYDATGIEICAADAAEGVKYFKKYLEYHRLKYDMESSSRTLPGKKQARETAFAFACAPDAPRADKRGRLSLIVQDAALALSSLRANGYHAAVCDLPYGVQHAPGAADSIEELLVRTLPGIRRVLKPGGALALSFNTHTLKPEQARTLLHRGGLRPLSGAPYEGNAHWVEQAILRDLVVGVKD